MAESETGGSSTTEITTDVLRAADGSNSAEYYDGIVEALNEYAAAYGLDTPLRIAHFLAQIGHESGFKAVEENGRYSAERMRRIFGCKGGPKNYDPATDDCKLGQLRSKLWTEEEKYAGNAENLLSYAYANRLGNGDEESGDGFRYRGRGMIQLTGKANYAQFTKVHNQKNPEDEQDFVEEPELLASLKYAVESAFFFWNSKGLNAIADTDDVAKVTLRVNGGDIGLPDRTARLKRVKTALGI
jgi:predicted chitinase